MKKERKKIGRIARKTLKIMFERLQREGKIKCIATEKEKYLKEIKLLYMNDYYYFFDMSQSKAFRIFDKIYNKGEKNGKNN